MSREKKSQVDDTTKLRKILDNPSDPVLKALISKDELALDSVRRRLAGDVFPIQKKSSHFIYSYDSMEPRVTIRAKVTPSRFLTPLPKYEPPATLPEFELISPSLPTMSVPPKESLFAMEDLFEVEKVGTIPPEFLEVTPKETFQGAPEKGMTILQEQTQGDNTSLPEWQPVQEEQVTTQTTQFEQGVVSVLPDQEEISLDQEVVPGEDATGEQPVEFLPIQPLEPEPEAFSKEQIREAKKAQRKRDRDEKRRKKLERKKLKIEKRENEREAKQIFQEQDLDQQTQEERQPTLEFKQNAETPQFTVDLNAFDGIASIDKKTAELLYMNGFFSIENVREATIDDIVQIHGIKRKQARQIKKEVDQKVKIKADSEFIPTKHKLSKKKSILEQEDPTEWESSPMKMSETATPSLNSYHYKGYALYKRETGKHGGRKTTRYIFSKEQLHDSHPTPLPKGYKILINKKTRVPYLKKRR
jgi:hypothetical protein